MRKLELLLSGTLSLAITACNSGSTHTSINQNPSAKSIPINYSCSPSQLPASNSKVNLKLAYAGNCLAESAIESQNMQTMAIALENWANKNNFSNNCTGTPIQYDLQSGVGFVVTAAHCVLNATPNKPAGEKIIPSYIGIYKIQGNGHNNAWVYQGYKASPVDITDLTAEITAVYLPSQFCESGILAGADCSNPQKVNGDIAVLKFKTQSGKNLSILPNLIVAPSDFGLYNNGINNQLLALGYGTTNPNGKDADPSNPYLYYINYQYYATDYSTSAYGPSSPFPVFDAPSTILNGYSINNNSYTIICHGDSGGGDFAWDGASWNLVGVHSWGYGDCGQVFNNVNAPASASTDVRRFNGWIQTIIEQDTQAEGCSNLGAEYVCASGSGS